MARTSGWASRRSDRLPASVDDVENALGQPRLQQQSGRGDAVRGVRSLGLRTNVLPQAIATGNIHIGIMAGKLYGQIPATTPKGWRYISTSTLVATFSRLRPCRCVVMPQASSTHSMPRSTSARASASTLPCSSVTERAMRSLFSSSRCLKRKRIRPSGTPGVSRHASNALAASATARSTTSPPESGTLAITSPVAGLYTSSYSRTPVLSHRPPIKLSSASKPCPCNIATSILLCDPSI